MTSTIVKSGAEVLRPSSPAVACLEDYPGAKNGSGVWQTIINNVPPHDLWIEAFAGSAQLTRRKRPAASSILIESDPAVCAALRIVFQPANQSLVEQLGRRLGTNETIMGNITLIQGDAVKFLERMGRTFPARTVVYCDPPYLDSVLAVPGRRYYRRGHGFGSEFLHADLLSALCVLKKSGVLCMVSGRRHPLYDQILHAWRRVDYGTATRAGAVTESLWCSFPEPDALHDWRWLGRNFRERERIKRKLARWSARLAKMPVLERRLVAAALAGNGDADRHAGNGDAGLEGL
jgi:16S rRNA G966 N2-methylase RsmD